ncbi:MAG: Ig-like domain-containing protein [Gemmatimonadaceae bacterium]
MTYRRLMSIMRATAMVPAATLLSAAVLSAQAPRLVVTPPAPRMAAGDTLRLTAKAVDASGQPLPNVQYRFQVAGGDNQAGIDSTGLVTATAPGTTVVAAVGLIAGQRPLVQRVTIAIGPGQATRLVLSPSVSRLAVGQRVRLVAQLFSAANDPATDAIRWSSTAPGVVSVSEQGVLTAVAPGRARLNVAAGRASAAVELTVVQDNLARLELSPANVDARQGDVVRFKAKAVDRFGKPVDGLTPTWSMAGGTGVIDGDGAFVGYEAATYTITASIGNRTAETLVKLAERDVRRSATLMGSIVRSAFSTSEVWVHPNGKVAYLGTLGDRLYTINITDPTKPTIVDSVVANTRHVNDIMTSADGRVLVFTRENADNRRNGIVICTLDDPLHPKPVAEFTEGVTAGVHSAFLYTQPKYGTHVYLTNDGTGAVHVIDINDPSHPKQVAVWKTPRADAGRYLHDIDVQDGLLYGSWWNDGLVVLDIGNGMKGGSPSNPQFVSQFKYDLDRLYRDLSSQDPAGYIRGTHTAWRHGKYVFIADEVFAHADIQNVLQKRIGRAYGTLQVIDVSDIANPKSVATYTPEYGGVHNIWVAGDTLYVGAYNGGFHAFDVSGELRGDLKAQGREIANFMTWSPNGAIPNAAMTWGAVVKDNLVFVNDFNSGLFILKLEPRKQVVP